MLSFDEALERVLGAATAVSTELVALEGSVGRVLREPLHAVSALPPFDYSSMDGYAVDTRAFGELPWTLPVRGESRAGHALTSLEPGTACRVFTGAPMPSGADAVVMQEDVELDGGNVRFAARPTSGDYVRREGEDLARGAVALEVGTRLGAYELGLAAAVDRAELVVARRPRVTILATGDELRVPGSAPFAASIPESNSVVIAALARHAGATARVLSPSKDDLAHTRREIEAALDDSDLLVTIGGVSVGDYDVVRPALEAAGVALDFHKVAMKPGKPLTLGRRGTTLVLGVPGNPASAQVTFTLFGMPLLRRLQGDQRCVPVARRVQLAAPIAQRAGRRGYYPSVVSGTMATPVAAFASGSTVSLARANALVVVPAEASGIDAGHEADALMLADF